MQYTYKCVLLMKDDTLYHYSGVLTLYKRVKRVFYIAGQCICTLYNIIAGSKLLPCPE